MAGGPGGGRRPGGAAESASSGGASRACPFGGHPKPPEQPENKRKIGVLFGGFGVKIEGDPWFTWLSHLPGPSICPKRTPMKTKEHWQQSGFLGQFGLEVWGLTGSEICFMPHLGGRLFCQQDTHASGLLPFAFLGLGEFEDLA